MTILTVEDFPVDTQWDISFEQVPAPRRKTYPVKIGHVTIGGSHPVVVQSMTNTDTEDAEATSRQIADLVRAGSEIVRITVNTPRAAQAVPEIRKRLEDMGVFVPLVGDFHYNGHRLLEKYPDCARTLDKYRINPGNVGRGDARSEQFARICAVARDLGKPVRIGVNAGSLDEDLVEEQMTRNSQLNLGKTSEEVLNTCMIISALRSTEQALAAGLTENQIVLSCKTSSPVHLIAIYRELARLSRQPLHLGLTEAGMAVKGLVWSAVAMGVLLAEGIGDTIRVSLTPELNGDRCQEVYAAQEMLQALGIRRFFPSITSCPGCGRTTSTAFQELAQTTREYIRQRLPEWKSRWPGAVSMTVAVMGCVVNGPGESRAADIGISLPGNGEHPVCPVYIQGQKAFTLSGDISTITRGFLDALENYVATKSHEHSG
ncbi:MAG TPA: flavodoxin-dependent (E)-4-hydroxy-3-methylbut-2-enyl-diphosphate synthase [Candidatus Hydrogenedentes bacterium]|nr:flavodoxin-dependent (E)-4-hydroxy-3-methylbut-2-enyl-diphosphate synthase [Candidatus Hydrogenedentota bacterium]